MLGFVASITTYEPVFTYAATAGMGSYNVSLTQPVINIPSNTANVVSQYFMKLFKNTDFEYELPLTCPTNSSGCGSHLFVGDLSFIQPIPAYFNNVAAANVVFAHQVQGLQVDVLVLGSGEMKTSDCKIWGNNQTAVQMCIANSTANPDALVAGKGPSIYMILITRAEYLYEWNGLCSKFDLDRDGPVLLADHIFAS